MKYYLGLFTFLVILACQKPNHPFEYYISKSDSCYFIKKYKKAGLYADSAFKIQEGTRSTYYNASCCWALANNKKKAFDYLDKAIDHGYLNIDWLSGDKDLTILHSSEQWDQLLKKLRSKVDAYEAHLNIPLKHELETIFEKDQMYRVLVDSIETNFGPDSKEMNLLWDKMAELDSINLKSVVEIIDKYGWPGISLVGESANKAVWIVIQHADLKTQEKYLPLLKESVQKQESDPADLAYLEDRILVRNNKPQIYGT